MTEASTTLREDRAQIANFTPALRNDTVLTPMDMLNRAVDQGAHLDVLEKLMGLDLFFRFPRED